MSDWPPGFDPRGSFRAAKPLMSRAYVAGKTYLDRLPKFPASDITRGYLHQSAEGYGCADSAYNFVIPLVNGFWMPVIAHDPRDNARSTFSETNYAEHTFRRNHGAIGIAVNGLDTPEASPTAFGKDPLEFHSIEMMCAIAAACSIVYGIDVAGLSTQHDDLDAPFIDEPTWLTHAEAANRVGVPDQYTAYGPYPGTCERWDLATLVQAPEGYTITAQDANLVGNELRRRIHDYRVALA